jgi:DNA-binding ferritin-like protein (Dps family)
MEKYFITLKGKTMDDSIFEFFNYINEELELNEITIMKRPDAMLDFSSNQGATKKLLVALEREGMKKTDYKLKQIKKYEPGDETSFSEVIFVDISSSSRAVMQLLDNDGQPIEPPKYLILNGQQVKYLRGQQVGATLHEIAFGIFAKDPSIELKDIDDIRVAAVNIFSDINAEDVTMFDKSIIDDSKILAKGFREKFDDRNPKEVIWTAKDSKYEPADVVLKYEDNTLSRISLKQRKAQLASLSPSMVTSIINTSLSEELENFGGRGSKNNFVDWLYSIDKYKKDLNEMTERWAKLILEFEIDNKELEKDLKQVSTWSDWKDVLSNKIYKDEISILSSSVTRDNATKKEWIKIRKETIVKVIRDKLEEHLEKGNEESVKNLYIKVFRIQDNPYFYVGESGKKIIRVPTKEEFNDIADNLHFEIQIKEDAADFQFIVNIGKASEMKTLMVFTIQFRWTQKQMIGNLSVVANQLKILHQEEVEKLIFPAS